MVHISKFALRFLSLIMIYSLFISLLFSLGCTKENEINRTGDNDINNLKVDSIPLKQDSFVRFGVMSDIQDKTQNHIYFTKAFNALGVDAIIIAGDTSNRKTSIQGKTDYQESYSVLEDILKNTELPVYVIPGNHESKKDYYDIISKLSSEHLNLIDLAAPGIAADRMVEFKGISIIPLPGYHIKEMVVDGGFLFNNVMEYYPMKDCLADPSSEDKHSCKLGKSDISLLVAHGPPKGITKNSIDAILSGDNLPEDNAWKNVGNQQINELMLNTGINFGVFGHIHEAGRKAVDTNDNLIEEGVWSDSLNLNAGPAMEWDMNKGEHSEGSAGIIDIDVENSKARYWIVEVE